jgi:T5SS/PEP-CTERM-associated repeat protein
MSRIMCRNGLMLVSCLAVPVAILNIFPRTALAQFSEYQWITGNGHWSTPSNWNPAGPPGSLDFAFFNQGGLVTIDDFTFAFAVVLGTASITFDVGGVSNSMFLLNSPEFESPSVIGLTSSEYGQLFLQNGTFSFPAISVSGAGGSQGDLTVRPNTVLLSTVVGLGGQANAHGRFIVDGGSAEIGALNMALNGIASLEVRNGGVLNSGLEGDDRMAYDVLGVANATVTGAGSHWTSVTLAVGKTGTATVNVNSQGILDVQELFVGYDQDSDGALFVENQGTVNVRQLAIGLDPGSHGSASVDGAGSVLNVMATTGNSIALLSADAAMSATNGGTINIGTGSPTSGKINVMPSGGLVGIGTVEGSVRNSGGTVWPMNSLSIVGEYAQEAGGELQVDVAGISAGQFGVLDVQGSAQLAGALDVRLMNNFQPNPGQQFVILTATNLVNNGIALTPAAADVFNLNVDTINDWVVITARAASVPGDYNENGVVDAADYVIWRATLGSTVDLRANGDDTGASQGRIDQADLNYWKARYGNTSGTGSGAPVPEPAGMVSIVVALMLAYARGGFVRSSVS